MLKKLLYLLPVALAAIACQPVHNCIAGPGCGEAYTFQEAGFCPNGYLFTNEADESVFIDYAAFANPDIPEEHFQALKKGDVVFMEILEPSKEDWIYHRIDLACPDRTKSVPEVDKWVQVTCISTLTGEVK